MMVQRAKPQEEARAATKEELIMVVWWIDHLGQIVKPSVLRTLFGDCLCMWAFCGIKLSNVNPYAINCTPGVLRSLIEQKEFFCPLFVCILLYGLSLLNNHFLKKGSNYLYTASTWWGRGSTILQFTANNGANWYADVILSASANKVNFNGSPLNWNEPSFETGSNASNCSLDNNLLTRCAIEIVN